MSDITKQLLGMREVFRMTGALSDVQRECLKMWCHVILAANKADVSIDADVGAATFDISDLDMTAMRHPEDDAVTVYKRRMDKFNQSIKFLLGSDFSVAVSIKGKQIAFFEGEGSAGIHAPKLEGLSEQERIEHATNLRKEMTFE